MATHDLAAISFTCIWISSAIDMIERQPNSWLRHSLAWLLEGGRLGIRFGDFRTLGKQMLGDHDEKNAYALCTFDKVAFAIATVCVS